MILFIQIYRSYLRPVVPLPHPVATTGVLSSKSTNLLSGKQIGLNKWFTKITLQATALFVSCLQIK